MVFNYIKVGMALLITYIIVCTTLEKPCSSISIGAASNEGKENRRSVNAYITLIHKSMNYRQYPILEIEYHFLIKII